MTKRRTWIKDIIKYETGLYIHIAEGETKYDVYDPDDSQFQRLLDEVNLHLDDLTYCEYGILQGNAGASMIDPFESQGTAIEWIREHAEDFYFVKNTVPELKRLFPEIPVRMHPKEVETKFKQSGWSER